MFCFPGMILYVGFCFLLTILCLNRDTYALVTSHRPRLYEDNFDLTVRQSLCCHIGNETTSAYHLNEVITRTQHQIELLCDLSLLMYLVMSLVSCGQPADNGAVNSGGHWLVVSLLWQS